ncbi:ATP-binding cassette domain-containing protein [Dyadobacter sp. CY356]|uniref:ATP-binding cassette domain-containing protein n=1 Tax=Dyadobacter sp. CY356 TaxID=2906442 RepID=UPI001F26FECC|nr:AAA family ATPase [Dyadobacter sp. CY356]MCF0055345.1 ATP-binding cassette domain-containing protein [Dyadobacter sp. CY356]
MRLAAIYIEEHEYLFNEPQTINFAGRYFYKFLKDANDITVSREENKNFIPNFFNLTNLETKVTNITAIVGQNGAGKSTLLDIIRSEFIQHEYALPQSKSIFLMEVDDHANPLVLRNDFGKVYLNTNSKKSPKTELKGELPKTPQTIYYSPHYDYKFNPNFDDVDNHDISFDRLVEKDLEDLNNKDTNEGGFPYSVSQELLFKNSLRQIQFLSSDLVKKQEIFSNIFHLQGHYDPILHFRGYKENETEWNTPYQLRHILKLINDKVKNEIDEWYLIREFHEDSVTNQLEINQYILKRKVIRCIVSLLYHQMERENSFLQKGHFPYDELEEEVEKADAYSAFLLFARHSGVKMSSDRITNVFSQSVLEALLNGIYRAIENADDEHSVTNESLKTTTNDAIEILSLQRIFLNELNSYHIKFYSNREELVIEDNRRIEEFINYMPFSRRMSSGENSLLNFFSRIYDFLHSNLKELKFRKLKDHYILLLDEGDLTFHLSWKKKYIKAILKTIPYFFNELENKPSLEIILTTHDPITLSDLPNPNVIYIERPDYDSASKILDFNDAKRPLKTFGANISNLIADSFFIENSLIGDFAFEKIQETIAWLNDKKNMKNGEYHKSVIRLIDEPIVQRKLAEMFDDKMQVNFQLNVIDEQINRLEELRKKLNS